MTADAGWFTGAMLRCTHLSMRLRQQGDVSSGMLTRVSGAGEFHPRALAEPDVSLSAHPAPVIPLPYGVRPADQ